MLRDRTVDDIDVFAAIRPFIDVLGGETLSSLLKTTRKCQFTTRVELSVVTK